MTDISASAASAELKTNDRRKILAHRAYSFYKQITHADKFFANSAYSRVSKCNDRRAFVPVRYDMYLFVRRLIAINQRTRRGNFIRRAVRNEPPSINRDSRTCVRVDPRCTFRSKNPPFERFSSVRGRGACRTSACWGNVFS